MYRRWNWLVFTLLVLAIVPHLFFSKQMFQKEKPLRLGLNLWPGYEFLYLADHLGFFEEEGVNIEIVNFSSLEDCKEAFARYRVDLMACTLTELILARQQTGRLGKIMFIADFSYGADVILSQKGIKTVQELRGKRIAIEPCSLGAYMIVRALQQVGMTKEEVELVGASQLDMLEYLKSGKVDAIVSYPPVALKVEKEFETNKIFDSTSIPGEIIDVVCADAHFLENYPEKAAAIMRAWDRAVAYSREHPEKAYSIMAHREGVSVEEFASALKGAKILLSKEQHSLWEEGGALMKALVLTQDILKENGEVDQVSSPVEFVDHGVRKRIREQSRE